MGKFRIIISIILIIAGAGLLIFWESAGREAFLTEEVLVAATPIPQGTVATPELFETASVLKENRMENALRPEEADRILGKTAAYTLSAKSQISRGAFVEDPLRIKAGQSLFALDPEWITMRSSALRRGDMVAIYEDRTYTLLGAFRVAFVKDSNEGEVQNIESSAPGELLDRTNATSVISHVEIIAAPEEYFRIREAVKPESPEEEKGPGLILVQKED
ncbi:MAG: SAF domain-containing protein [Firmicutes bacterium]|nr:SAF domain-containing protein [Bacillota bacterium]